ncbi:MAG: hypothetical protein Q9217_004255 [Psora testacea]
MASQQGLPPNQRFLSRVGHDRKKKDDSIETERAKRQEEIERLASDALPIKKTDNKHSSAPQTFQPTQKASTSGGRIVSELDSESLTPKASRRAALPSPPLSPVTSTRPIELASATPSTSTMNSLEIAHLHAALHDHQCQIYSLTLKLEDTQAEVQSLYKERREASNEKKTYF